MAAPYLAMVTALPPYVSKYDKYWVEVDSEFVCSLFAVKVKYRTSRIHALFSEAPSAICISTKGNMLLAWFPTACCRQWDLQERGGDLNQSVSLSPLPYDIIANSVEVYLFEELKCESPLTNLSKAKAEFIYLFNLQNHTSQVWLPYDYPWLMWLTIICQTMQYINQTCSTQTRCIALYTSEYLT